MSDVSMFRGTGVALVTPFKNHIIDFNAYADVIDHVLDGGVEYLVPLGTTGEAVTLTTQECQQVIDFTVERAKGKVPVVGGLFGSNNTARLIQYIRDFDVSRLDALLSSCPAYVKPSQEGLYRHYSALAEASPKPIILYNVPSRTGVNMLPATVIRLAEKHSNIVAIKEATGDLGQMEKITKNCPDDFLLLSGDDPTAMASLSIGGQGVISVIANAFPRIFSDMIRHGLQGEFKEAHQLNQKLQDVHRWLYIEGNPVGIKAALEYRGLCTREVRLPLAELSEENLKHLVQELGKINN